MSRLSGSSSLRLAERVSFETLVNCYVHELGGGTWHGADSFARRVDLGWRGRGAFVLELALSRAGLRVALDVTYRSAVGCHAIAGARCARGEGRWEDGDELDVMLALVRELFSDARGGTRADELEMLQRLLESQSVMARYLEARSREREPPGERFIDSEQSLLYGHWRHPVPKSRQGITDWQHASVAPELRGRFRLHGFAVARAQITQDSALEVAAETLVAAALGVESRAATELEHARARDAVLVPVHPLQVDWLLHQPHVAAWLQKGLVRDVGPLGPWFTATSSVRTVYSEACPFMFKLSIPVKITNSVRANQRHELLAGIAAARLMAKLPETGVAIVSDPAYLTADTPHARESGFELIVRENPFVAGRDVGVHSVAALAQRALPHQPARLRALIEGLALTESRTLRSVGLEFLLRYLICAIEPLIRLYDSHGVALEAHQQNTLLDVTAGYPRRCYFRDNQGFYLSRSHRDALLALAPELAERSELFFDDAVIRRHFSYYLVQNQLFAVVHRLGREDVLEEGAALAVVRARLTRLTRELGVRGGALVRELLGERTLPCKANLLIRARNVDELTDESGVVYVGVENPIRAASADSAELEVA
jgi:siderophore synthetase component